VIVFAKTDEAHWKLGHQFEHRSVDKRYLAVVHGLVEPDVQVIDLPIGPHPSREKGYREKYVVRHDELGKASVTIVRVRERYVVGRDAGTETRRHEVKTAASSLPSSAGWNLPELPKRVDVAAGGANSNPFEADMGRFSLVELELKSGRTHQIRVHLSHNLWPIVGDDMYGGKVVGEEALGIGLRASGKKKSSASRSAKAASASGEHPSMADAQSPMPLISRQALHATMLGFDHPITRKPLRFVAPVRGDMAALVHSLRAASGGGEVVEAMGATIDVGTIVPAKRK
jgi:23S rRNA pseudouridine1911/1915/1917 synthase